MKKAELARAKQPKGNLWSKLPFRVKLLLLPILLASASGVALADPVWATIIDTDFTGERHSWYFDKDGDGFEDGVMRIVSDAPRAPVFRRYLPAGSRILYENRGKSDFYVSISQLLRIEMPDGRLIKVVDIIGPNAAGYDDAYAYEAQQAAKAAQNTGR
jgi:hypothetical protein